MVRARGRKGRGMSNRGRGSRDPVQQSILDAALEAVDSFVEQTVEERENTDSNMARVKTAVQEVKETIEMAVENENSDKGTTGEGVRGLDEKAAVSRTSQQESENVEKGSSTVGGEREGKESENKEMQKETDAQNDLQSVSEEVNKDKEDEEEKSEEEVFVSVDEPESKSVEESREEEESSEEESRDDESATESEGVSQSEEVMPKSKLN